MNSAERHRVRYERRVKERKDKREKYKKNDSYEDVFSFTNLFDTYKECLAGVSWKKSVQKFKANAMLNLYHAYIDLMKSKFQTGTLHGFDIVERGKPRHIQSSSFTDKTVQRCLSEKCLMPLLSKSFIYDNYANQKGKGVLFALNRLTAQLHRYYRQYGAEGYILQFDFSKYFDSLSHEFIEELVNKRVHDARLRDITKAYVAQYGDIGLGLGSTVSQILALAFTDYIDHFFKEELHIKYYGRYMDDGYIISNDKRFIHLCYELLVRLSRERGLILNIKKTHITKLSHGFTFMKIKYNLTDSGKVVRRIAPKNITRMRRKVKKFKQKVLAGEMSVQDAENSVQSWLGYASHFNSYKSRKKILDTYQEIKKSFSA